MIYSPGISAIICYNIDHLFQWFIYSHIPIKNGDFPKHTLQFIYEGNCALATCQACDFWLLGGSTCDPWIITSYMNHEGHL